MHWSLPWASGIACHGSEEWSLTLCGEKKSQSDLGVTKNSNTQTSQLVKVCACVLCVMEGCCTSNGGVGDWGREKNTQWVRYNDC